MRYQCAFEGIKVVKPYNLITFLCLISISSAYSEPSDPSENETTESQPRAYLDEGPSFTVLGVGALYVPVYEGADTYRLVGVPMIEAQRGRIFIGARRGLGINLSSEKNVNFGPRLSYRGDRVAGDAINLHGLGDVNGGLEAGAFISINMHPWFIKANIVTLLDDKKSDSVTANLGFGKHMRVSTQDLLIIDTSITWVNSRYASSYFGVDSNQSERSGFVQYEANAGIKSYGLGMLWTHSYNKEWSTSIRLHKVWLVGSAASSPVVLSNNHLIGMALLGYRY